MVGRREDLGHAGRRIDVQGRLAVGRDRARARGPAVRLQPREQGDRAADAVALLQVLVGDDVLEPRQVEEVTRERQVRRKRIGERNRATSGSPRLRRSRQIRRVTAMPALVPPIGAGFAATKLIASSTGVSFQWRM